MITFCVKALLLKICKDTNFLTKEISKSQSKSVYSYWLIFWWSFPFSFDWGLKFEYKKSVLLRDWVKNGGWDLGPQVLNINKTKKMTNMSFLSTWVLRIDFVRKYIKFLKITIFEDPNLNLLYLMAIFKDMYVLVLKWIWWIF